MLSPRRVGQDTTPQFGPIRDAGGCDIDLGMLRTAYLCEGLIVSMTLASLFLYKSKSHCLTKCLQSHIS